MPRRRALTEAQMENLLALPTDEAAQVQHWTLSAADLAAIDQFAGQPSAGAEERVRCAT